MNILLLGENGQLGWELKRTCPDNIQLTTCDFPKVDFLNPPSIEDCIESSQPEVIINSAAYTAVDKAEQEPDLAYKINRDAVKQIAGLCRQKNIMLVHVSTDYVFNGKGHTPYKPQDKTDPQSVYGQSKLEGEQAVQDILDGNSLTIRTAWLYSSHGQNFVKTMIKLMAEKEKLTVVDDQIGSPTWAFGLATTIWTAISKNLTGVYHWTDAGVASWYDFALAIQKSAINKGLLTKKIPILPVPTSAYPTLAQRPPYSVLDKQSIWQALNIEPVHWQSQLGKMIADLN